MTRAQKNEIIESNKAQATELESKIAQDWATVKEMKKEVDWFLQIGQVQGFINDLERMLELSKGIEGKRTQIFKLEKHSEYLEERC